MAHIYFVSYFCKSAPGTISFGSAEVELSKPISKFGDVIGMSETIAARISIEAVSVLTWQLLREEADDVQGDHADD